MDPVAGAPRRHGRHAEALVEDFQRDPCRTSARASQVQRWSAASGGLRPYSTPIEKVRLREEPAVSSSPAEAGRANRAPKSRAGSGQDSRTTLPGGSVRSQKCGMLGTHEHSADSREPQPAAPPLRASAALRRRRGGHDAATRCARPQRRDSSGPVQARTAVRSTVVVPPTAWRRG